jgi:lysozyme family protein
MKKPDFDEILDFVIRWEGGYRVHRNPGEGSITFAGIYREAHPEWEGWKHVDRGEIEKAKAHVREFYRLNFWLPLKCNHMDPVPASALFDTAVNIGVRRSARAIQKLVGVYPDGIIGPITLRAIKSQDPAELARELLKRRIIYYSRLDCERFNLFKRGWINRVFDLMKFLEV